MPNTNEINPTHPQARLGITDRSRVWIAGHNIRAKRAMVPVLAGSRRPASGPIDLAVIAPITMEEAVYFVQKIRTRLVPTGKICVIADLPVPADGKVGPSADDLEHRMSELGFSAAARTVLGSDHLLCGFRDTGSARGRCRS